LISSIASHFGQLFSRSHAVHVCFGKKIEAAADCQLKLRSTSIIFFPTLSLGWSKSKAT